jgi:hypothetical protein
MFHIHRPARMVRSIQMVVLRKAQGNLSYPIPQRDAESSRPQNPSSRSNIMRTRNALTIVLAIAMLAATVALPPTAQAGTVEFNDSGQLDLTARDVLAALNFYDTDRMGPQNGHSLVGVIQGVDFDDFMSNVDDTGLPFTMISPNVRAGGTLSTEIPQDDGREFNGGTGDPTLLGFSGPDATEAELLAHGGPFWQGNQSSTLTFAFDGITEPTAVKVQMLGGWGANDTGVLTIEVDETVMGAIDVAALPKLPQLLTFETMTDEFGGLEIDVSINDRSCILAGMTVTVVESAMLWNTGVPEEDWGSASWTNDGGSNYIAPIASKDMEVNSGIVNVTTDLTATPAGSLSIGAGTVNVAGGGAGTLAVTRDVNVGTDGTLEVNGALTGYNVSVATGGALDVNGTLGGTNLNITGGAVTVASGGSATLANSVSVDSGSLIAAGALTAPTVTTAGTFTATGALDITTLLETSGDTNLTGATGTIAKLDVTGGTATIGATSPTIPQIDAIGGVLNTASNLTNLNVVGGTVNTTAAVAVTGHLQVDTGQLNLNGGNVSVVTVTGATTGGAGIDASTNALVVSGTARLGALTIAADGPAFELTGANLLDIPTAKTVTLAGGTVTMTTLGGAAAAPGAPGAVIDSYSIAVTSTTTTADYISPLELLNPLGLDVAGAGTGPYTYIPDTAGTVMGLTGDQHATDHNGSGQTQIGTTTAWFKFDMGQNYYLDELRVWNGDFFRADTSNPDRFSAKQTDLYYSSAEADPGDDSATGWTLIGDLGVRELSIPTIASGGASNGLFDVTDEIDLNNIDARWFAMKVNSTHGQPWFRIAEVQFIEGEKVVKPLVPLNAPNTSIVATETSTLAAPLATGAITLGGIEVAASKTLTFDSPSTDIQVTNLDLGGGSQILSTETRYVPDPLHNDRDVTITVSGKLAAGGGVGRIGDSDDDDSNTNLTLADGSVFEWTFSDGDDYIDLAGNLTLESGELGITINLIDGGGTTTGPADVQMVWMGNEDISIPEDITINKPTGSGWTFGDLVYDGEYLVLTGLVTGTVTHTPGDATGDHIVDADDLAIFKAQFGLTGIADLSADFDDDTDIDLADFAILRGNWGAGVGSAPEIGDVTPEPATIIVMLAAGLPALLKRRRRRS